MAAAGSCGSWASRLIAAELSKAFPQLRPVLLTETFRYSDRVRVIVTGIPYQTIHIGVVQFLVLLPLYKKKVFKLRKI